MALIAVDLVDSPFVYSGITLIYIMTAEAVIKAPGIYQFTMDFPKFWILMSDWFLQVAVKTESIVFDITLHCQGP